VAPAEPGLSNGLRLGGSLALPDLLPAIGLESVLRGRVRKVRAAQGTVLDNIEAEQSDGKCNRKDTAGGSGQSAVGGGQEEKSVFPAHCRLLTAHCLR